MDCITRSSDLACIGGTFPDPIRFQDDLKVTIQALGWRTHRDRAYLPLQDDIASVAYWYQDFAGDAFSTAARSQ